MTEPTEVLLELDSRRRVALGSLCGADDRYFLASRRPDGSVLLRPAEVRPKVMSDLDAASPGWRADIAADLEAGLPAGEPAEWERLKQI